PPILRPAARARDAHDPRAGGPHHPRHPPRRPVWQARPEACAARGRVHHGRDLAPTVSSPRSSTGSSLSNSLLFAPLRLSSPVSMPFDLHSLCRGATARVRVLAQHEQKLEAVLRRLPRLPQHPRAPKYPHRHHPRPHNHRLRAQARSRPPRPATLRAAGPVLRRPHRPVHPRAMRRRPPLTNTSAGACSHDSCLSGHQRLQRAAHAWNSRVAEV
ncbi:hypothetical protein C8J57DRAFT_1572382, partial [Mycena rebaudengoi]